MFEQLLLKGALFSYLSFNTFNDLPHYISGIRKTLLKSEIYNDEFIIQERVPWNNSQNIVIGIG